MDMNQLSRFVTVEAMGVEILVEVSGAGADQVVAEVLATWDRCNPTLLEAPGAPVGDETLTVRVMLDDDQARIAQAWQEGILASHLLPGVMEQLTPRITQRAIEHLSHSRLMLHASGLADPSTGRTAILVGASGAGKSTASRALAKVLAYVSDETVCLDVALKITPYPKPLSLFPAGRAWGKEQISPNALGLNETPESPGIGAVLVLSRNADGPARPLITQLTTVEAIVRLGEQTSYLERLERPLHRLAELVHAAGGAHLVEYREAEDLADTVRELLSRDPNQIALPSEISPQVVRGESGADGELLQACELSDFYVEAGMGVALVDGRLIALSGLATTVVTLLASEPLSLRDLSASLVAEYGLPDDHDPLELTNAVVGELDRNGLLGRRQAGPLGSGLGPHR